MMTVKNMMLVVLLLKISSMCFAQNEFRLASRVHYFVGDSRYGDSIVYSYSGGHGSINTATVEARGYDSSISWSLDNGKYLPHWKTTLLYDSLGRINCRTESRYEGNEWGDPIYFIVNYDDRGDTLSMIQKEWTGDDTIEVTKRDSYEYDTMGHRITSRHSDDHGFQTESKSTYDINGLCKHLVWTARSYGKITETGDNTYEYSPTNKPFKQRTIHTSKFDQQTECTTSLDTFVYDSNDSLITETAITNFLSMTDHGSFQHRFRYDTLRHSIVQEHICWDNMTCDWSIYSIDSTIYDSHHLVTTGYTWYFGAPHDDEMWVYEHNEARRCLSVFEYKGKNNEWHPDFNVIYTYDEHGLLVSENSYVYREGNQREADRVTSYHYETVPK